ncbi:NfeD family protein [Neisseria leonii]|uniref:NfeD family protein n=1 Tax=Neisseria leonii TaxID=2995413 RepID=UPI0030CFD974
MYWFAAAVTVFIIEMFLGTAYLLILGAALTGGAIVSLFSDGLTLPVLTTAVLSAAGLIWFYLPQNRRSRRPDREDTGDLDIGQTVQVVRHLHTDHYEVAYRGTFWQARALNHMPDSAATTAVINGKEGNTLLVRLH